MSGGGGSNDADLRAWLSLSSTSVERSLLLRLLQHYPSPEEILGLSDTELAGQFGFTARNIAGLRRAPSQKALDQQLRLMEGHRIQLIPLTSPEFPRNLFELNAPPPVVFVKGALATQDRMAVGIVGPRTPTAYGVEVTRSLSRDFARFFTVVSGAALGIDSAAHEVTMKAGGRTLAVLGCGIDIDYPVTNGALRAAIAAGEQGALVSIFPPGTPPLRGNFPIRNVILAGLSLAVVVVEASEKSGALVTARAAADEGRPVYAVPGDITRLNSKGVNRLLREGATVCTCANDLLEDLAPLLSEELAQVRPHESAAADLLPTSGDNELTALHGEILETIRHAPISHDALIDHYGKRGVGHGELSTILLDLEMDGHIHQLPGRLYSPRL